jgi:peptide/nickel transport system permease protein
MLLLEGNAFFQTPEEKTAFDQQVRGLWGLNQPFVPQYFTYVRNLLSWNFGAVGTPLVQNQKVTPIIQSLQEKLPFTLFILGTATAISLLIGILWGIAAVKKRDSLFDKFSYYFPTIMVSSPVWWIGALLLLVFTEQLNWFPRPVAVPISIMAGRLPATYTVDSVYSSHAFGMIFNVSIPNTLEVVGGYLSYSFLPICALVLSTFGGWVLLTKAALLETIGADYLVTARAKGVSEWKVLTKHAMRNAYLPIVTSAAMSFAFIIVGSAMLEVVFNYPGIGLWLWKAVLNLDYAILMTVFYVLAICVIIANIITDLLYGILDPRIRSG